MAGRGLIGRVLGALPGNGRMRYRIACLAEEGFDVGDPFWRRWPELFDTADSLFRTLPKPTFLQSPLSRKLGWSEKNNRKWVDELAAEPPTQPHSTEFWSPWRKDLEDRSLGGPHLYAKIDSVGASVAATKEFDWQSLTLALRHDVLPGSMAAAQALFDRAQALMPKARLITFDRSWAERGNWTSFIRVNGLEDSYPSMLQDWYDAHPQAAVDRFDFPLR